MLVRQALSKPVSYSGPLYLFLSCSPFSVLSFFEAMDWSVIMKIHAKLFPLRLFVLALSFS